MSISFGGVGELCVTMKAASSVKKGWPVKMSASDTAAACASGDRVMGVAVDVSGDGYATVQVRGYADLPYTGSAPAVGFATIGADGSGGVKTVSGGGGEALVIHVDTAAMTVGIML